MQSTAMLLHPFQPSLLQAEMQVEMWIFVQINYVTRIMYTAVNCMVISAASLMITHHLFLSVVRVIFGWVNNVLHVRVLIIQHS